MSDQLTLYAKMNDCLNLARVLVPITVKDIVAGSVLALECRGARHLEGVPCEWRRYAVAA